MKRRAEADEGILTIIGTQHNHDLACCGSPTLMFDAHAATPRLILLVHAFSVLRSIFSQWLDQQETKPQSKIAGFSGLQIMHPNSRNYFSIRASTQAVSPRLNIGDLLSVVNRAVGVALQHCRFCRPAGFTQQQLYKEVRFLSVPLLALPNPLSAPLHLHIRAPKATECALPKPSVLGGPVVRTPQK